MFYPVVFTADAKIIMENVFTSEKKMIEFSRGQTTEGRIDKKQNNINNTEVYFMDSEGWGGIVPSNIIERVS